MPILTWQNVPQTDLSVGQQGVRTASELLSRAVNHTSEGLTQLKGVEDAQKAAQVAAADRLVLQKTLALQDPAQHGQMMSEIAAGPAGGLASAQALLNAEARQDTLFKRTDEATKRGELAYQTTRAHGFDEARDAASPMAAEAAKLAFSDPAKAEALFAKSVQGMGLSLEDQQKQMSIFRQLYIDPSSRMNASMRMQELALQGKAASLADRMRKAGNPLEAASIFNAEKDARVKFGAENMLRGAGENITQTVTGSNATLGLDPAAMEPDSPAFQFTQAISERKRKLEEQAALLPDGAKILRNSRELGSLDTAGVAQKLAPQIKAENWAEVADWIRKAQVSAEKAGITLTPAQAGGVLLDALQEDGIFNWPNFNESADVVVGRLDNSVRDIKNNQGILDRFEETERAVQFDEKKLANYTQKEFLARLKQRRAGVIPESEAGAAEAMEEAKTLEGTLRRRLGLDKKPEQTAVSKLNDDIGSLARAFAEAAAQKAQQQAGQQTVPALLSKRRPQKLQDLGAKVKPLRFNDLEDVP